uniref:Transporter n=1 Tax=Saccoglossus kowalevskii TaxID=10224 RepID=A0ABM0GZW1_SACKO|nr:PREDICTED: sodium- and chloride-dependent glycine transporter 1-like [Saccoglossus kowalevskii]
MSEAIGILRVQRSIQVLRVHGMRIRAPTNFDFPYSSKLRQTRNSIGKSSLRPLAHNSNPNSVPRVPDSRAKPDKKDDIAPHEFEGDENEERGNWSKQLDFILSCIGFAVGLGNVWRFPYLCYSNGGGAFLIPYTIMLFLAGIPLFFMELAFGQFASQGPFTIWTICPLFKGVGYAMVTISFLVTIYYNVIIGYAIYYIFASFADVLPWVGCDHEWNTDSCGYPPQPNGTVINGTWISQEMVEDMNITVNVSLRISPAQEYWNNEVLRISDGIDDMGKMRWQLTLCLVLAWVVVFLCLIRGIKSSGKVVYVTATFPYVVLLILLIRGLTLPGASKGIDFYMTPQWELLMKPKIWKDAASQIFYSLGPAWGGLLTMASYNKFHNNCYRDSIIVSLVNCGTSVFAGFVVFSIIGFISHEIGVPVEDVVDQGPGLVFIVYPEALARMPGSQVWSILFFLMLFTLGLDSQFAMVETVVSSFMDEYPRLRQKKAWVVGGVCTASCLLGLPMVTQGGIYLLQVVDVYSAGISLMLVAVTECLVIAGIYGVNNFWDDIQMMLGYKPVLWLWFTVCWCGITPLIILGIIIFGLVLYAPVSYGSYVYPAWAEIIGWLMACASLVMIPLFMFIQYCFYAEGDGFIEKMKYLLRPTPQWGPALEKHRTGKYALPPYTVLDDSDGKNGPMTATTGF